MNFEVLKEAIDNLDFKTTGELLVELYISNPENFIKKLLYSNSIPEPIEISFSDDKLTTIYKAFHYAGLKMIERNIDVDISKYRLDFMKLITVINILNTNIKSNKVRLENNDFLNQYTLAEQLHIMCIYIEDQHRLSPSVKKNEKGYFTGLENEVALHEVDYLEGLKISITDNFEALIEIADTLFRYLYYKGKISLKENNNFIHQDITPYRNASFEELVHLANQKNSYDYLWEKIKYRQWKHSVQEENDDKHHLFLPTSKEDYKKERIAINRYIYRDHINVQKNNVRYKKENRLAIQNIEIVSKKLDINEVESLFELHKNDFEDCSIIIKNLLNGQLESLEEIYLDLEKDGVKILDLIKGFEYLYTIAKIYQTRSHSNFDQDDDSKYKQLTPIIDIEKLIHQFSEFYGLEEIKSKEILKLFTFSNKPLLDVFSQPLIYVGKSKVIFCPALILQMNIIRIIESIVSKWGINIADKGIIFEKELRLVLPFNPYIEINTNKIEFLAYDGRDVEFDFIGTFEDYLLLIEFKHITIPFSDKAKKTASDILDVGINQVNRREKIIFNDWNKIREKSSINLPELAPEKDKIIKLVCTNIFDFSTITRNGVEIIDSSSLLKFFLSPEIKSISVGEELNEVLYEKLWANGYPTVKEFLQFLNSPIAIRPFENCFEERFTPILKINELDNNIYFYDAVLTKDPYEEVNGKIFSATITNKIGRNELCPCGSKIKYKKCCLKAQK
jgi:hypothetical protein